MKRRRTKKTDGKAAPVRLQKFLAHSGIASRRAAEELIRQGRVTVNGRVVTEMGVTVDPSRDRVRYDGTHKRDHFLVDTLGSYVSYVPVCPEVECGMPIPRESLRLVGDPENPRLVTLRTKKDFTDQMKKWA